MIKSFITHRFVHDHSTLSDHAFKDTNQFGNLPSSFFCCVKVLSTVGPLCNIRCCEHISGKVLKTSNMLLGTFRGIKGTRIWYLLTSQAQGIDIIKAELLGGQEKRACFWPKTAFWKSPISQKVFNIFWWFFFAWSWGHCTVIKTTIINLMTKIYIS